MEKRLCVGVMGAGSIGCYVGGKLQVGGAVDVVFVGRTRLGDELAASGLTVKDFDREGALIPPEKVQFSTDITALSACDVVLCCVKSAQTEEVATQLAQVLREDAAVLSLQNGVGNAPMLREHLPGRRVVAGIVGFNVVSRGEGLFHRAMSGALMFEEVQEPALVSLMQAFRETGLEVQLRADLLPDQWTKLLVNLNNAVSALSGAPTRQLLLVPGYRHIVADVVEEAMNVLRAAGIRPAKLRGVPVGWMPRVLRLPTPLVRLVTRAQMRVDPQARSSMWEDLMKKRPTEVDYLNGEIVRLAQKVGVKAPINQRIVECIREAEAQAKGSPELSPEALRARLLA